MLTLITAKEAQFTQLKESNLSSPTVKNYTCFSQESMLQKMDSIFCDLTFNYFTYDKHFAKPGNAIRNVVLSLFALVN